VTEFTSVRGEEGENQFNEGDVLWHNKLAHFGDMMRQRHHTHHPHHRHHTQRHRTQQTQHKQRGKFLLPIFLVSTIASTLIMLEDNESESSKNIIEEVSWFYTNRAPASRSPIRRWLYNFKYRLACMRATLRFSAFVRPFTSML